MNVLSIESKFLVLNGSPKAIARLRGGWSICISATGRSMLPSIREGDLVVVSPANWTEVHPGEVVVFTASDGIVAHRLVSVERCYQGVFFRTKGDGFDWEDPLASPDRIVGKVVFLIRDGTPIAVPPLPARALWRLWLRRVVRLPAATARRLRALFKVVT